MAVVTLLAILGGVQGLWVVRSEIWANKAKILQFLVPGLLGVPVGVMLLDYINAETLRIGVGFLLVLYGGYFSSRAVLPAISRATPKTDCSVGLIGGVLGGLASLSGAIPSLWLSLRPWTKGEIRTVLQPFNMAVLTTTATLLFLKGAYDNTAIDALKVAIRLH